MRGVARLMLAAAVMVAVCGGAWGGVTPASQASPMQLAKDDVQGDWQGRVKLEGSAAVPLCAQVIALGNGAYRANLLGAFDTRDPQLAVIEGKTADGAVRFSGTGAAGLLKGAAIQASITEGDFSGALSGQIAGTFEMKHVVRNSPTLGAKPPEGAVVLFDGTSLDGWEQHVVTSWSVNLKEHVGGEQCAAYLRARVWSPKDQDARLELGTDDGVKAWLNGELVHAKNTMRGLAPGEDKVDISLKRGLNELMLKVTQGGGGWEACAAIRARDGGPLAGLRAVDPSLTEKEATLEIMSAQSLEDSEGHVPLWEVTQAYKKDGVNGEGLFDVAFPPEEGKTATWRALSPISEPDRACKWKLLDNGVMEVTHGSIVTKRQFGDCRLHIEFRTPFMPEARGQARGNSGVYFQGRYEVQVLDSYGLEGLDNECGGIYKIARPRVNMCAPPLQWQTYDAVFHTPRFDASGKKLREARITVEHNGVLIHEEQEIPTPTTAAGNSLVRKPGPIYLQDHANPVQYRNIWLVEIGE